VDQTLLGRDLDNLIGGRFVSARSKETFEKRSPHDGALLCRAARSTSADVDDAVAAARAAQPDWARTPPVARGALLHAFCNLLEANTKEIARTVALETGKTPAEAAGETGGAIALGRFFAGEGQRLYGRTTTSGQPNRYAMTVRQPCGVAALIIAANTPIANVAWKVFPALVAGNAAILKSAEDAPATAEVFARLARKAGLPAGVLNVLNGLGEECGAPLVEHDGVDVISFTGSARVGRWIAETAGRKLKKVSLELGGKNPLVVCDDADFDHAVRWAALSAFSNAGQRCASASRIIVFDTVYEDFRARFVAAAENLRLGPEDGCDLGPVINERQLKNMLAAVGKAKAAGAAVLAGGRRLDGPEHAKGCYMAPTVIEGAGAEDEITRTELFGPVACLYRVRDFGEALALANTSPYGLTAAIHTTSYDRAMQFTQEARAGVVTVNGGTYGSEPHMPFGGFGQSGNGSREPGTEALDVYCELKDVYHMVRPEKL